MAIPGGEVLNRLAEAHVLTYRTDLNGAVTFYLDGTTVSAVLPESNESSLPAFR